MKQLSIIFLSTMLAISCARIDTDKILEDKDFESGNWLLVNKNYAQKTLLLIDDEKILKRNRNGLSVSPNGECGGTTCDGFLMLYKDGKLISEMTYLMSDVVNETSEIKSAYKTGEEIFIEPINANDYKKKWDSLIEQNSYPTFYRSQPKDKNIIWLYRQKH